MAIKNKKMKPFETSTETSVRVGAPEKIMIAVMMVSSLVFAAGLFSGFSRLIRREPPPPPPPAVDEFKDSGTVLYAPGEVLVKYTVDVAEEDKDAVLLEAISETATIKERDKVFSQAQVLDDIPITESVFAQEKKVLDAWEEVTFNEQINVDQAISELLNDPRVEYAEPNYIAGANWVSNDTYMATYGSWGQSYKDLWGFYDINTDKAWDVVYPYPNRGDLNNDGKITSADIIVLSNYLNGTATITPEGNGDVNADGVMNTADRDYLNTYVFQSGPHPITYNLQETHPVVVAVADSGIDATHVDIDANLWVNEDEIPGDFIDNDNNGYIDDRRGYSFVHCIEYDLPFFLNCIDWEAQTDDVTDLFGHGTHVAGTIAAEMNNSQGIAGVCPHCKIMPLRVMGKQGFGETSEVAESVRYAADNGADIYITGWGGVGDSTLLHDAIKYAYSKDVVIIAPAGNLNIDAAQQIPAKYPEVISVGSIDQNDVKSSFSNWGKIDITAPGGGSNRVNSGYESSPVLGANILSLRAKDTDMTRGMGIVATQYLRSRGTSFSAPQVAGVAALVKARHPEYTNGQVRAVLMQSAKDLTHTAFNCTPYSSEASCHTANITCAWGNNICTSWDVSYGENYDSYTGSGKVDAYAAVNLNNPLNVELTLPDLSTGVIFHKVGQPLDIKGTAKGALLSYFVVEVAPASRPTEWIEIARSTAIVDDGTLATWNVNGDYFGKYNVRVKAVSTNGTSVEQQMPVYVGYIPRFPVQSYGFLTEPSFIDINNSIAGPEIIVRDNNYVRGYYSNGTFFRNNDIVTNGSAVSVSDVDQNGKFEIMITFANTIKAFEAQDYDANGVYDNLLGWPVTMSQIDPSMIIFPPVIPPLLADINNDGNQEVIIGHQSGFTSVYKIDGSPYGGLWPVQLQTDNGKVNVNPIVVGNLDSDSNLEIAVAGYDRVYLFNDDGSAVPGWPKVLDSNNPKISISDIDIDGSQELIIATNTKLFAFHGDGSQLFAFSPPENPRDADFKNYPVTGEVDTQIPGKEIVVSFAIPSRFYWEVKAYLVSANGTLLNNDKSIITFPESRLSSVSSPILADINGDGEQEIFMRKEEFVHGVYKDGSNIDNNWPLTVYSIPNSGSVASPAIFDFDNDGELEVVVEYGRYLQVFKTNYTGGTSAWPMYQHDPQHTGNADL